jgi:hypothetical protein
MMVKPGAQPKGGDRSARKKAGKRRNPGRTRSAAGNDRQPRRRLLQTLSSPRSVRDRPQFDPELDPRLNPNLIRAIASHKAGKPFVEAVEDALKTGRFVRVIRRGAVRNGLSPAWPAFSSPTNPE